MAAAVAAVSLLLFLSAQGAAPVLGFTRGDFPEDFVFGSATSAYQVTDAPIIDQCFRAWNSSFFFETSKTLLFLKAMIYSKYCSMFVEFFFFLNEMFVEKLI